MRGSSVSIRGLIFRLTLLLPLLPGTAWASLLVYEGFDYLPGQTLPTMSGGTGWVAAPWTGSGSMVDDPPTLDHPGALIPSGDALLNPDPGEAFRSFGMLVSNAGSEVWISFMEESLILGSGALVSFDPLGGPGSGSVSVAKDAGGSITVSAAGSTSLAVSSAGVGATDFFVLRLSQFSVNTTIDLFLNPTGPLGAPTVSLTVPMLFSLSQTFFITDPDQRIDEIRIGTEAGDVAAAVPEPARALLLGLGALAVAWARRGRGARAR